MAEMLDFNDVKGRLGVSESTLVNMILFEKFPMQKNSENTYEMSVAEFDEWSTGAATEKDAKKSMRESKFNETPAKKTSAKKSK